MYDAVRKLLNIGKLWTMGMVWQPYSQMLISGDESNWSLSWEALAIQNIAKKLGIHGAITPYHRFVSNQAIFLTSKYFLRQSNWLKWNNRIAFPYYHGLPGTGYREFDECYESLRKHHEQIHRIQVTHEEVKNLILNTGIAPEKVHKIYIGINLHQFPERISEGCGAIRQRLELPPNSFVIGSFQKDGVGWGYGFEPKLIKGPDIFIETMDILSRRIPELHILLSGPARGYVKNGLDRLGIPYRDLFLENYAEIFRMYHACDAYLVTSRQEGGPKAILEAMATGVPLVSTRVGQAQELIVDGENGFLAPIGDARTLADHIFWIYENPQKAALIVRQARATAESNSYESQISQWDNFFCGFVNYQRNENTANTHNLRIGK